VSDRTAIDLGSRPSTVRSPRARARSARRSIAAIALWQPNTRRWVMHS